MDVSPAAAVAALLPGYQTALWPAVVAAYALASAAIASVLLPHRHGRAVPAAVLAVLWIWCGAAWFALTVGRVSAQQGWFFAGLSFTQAALIVLAAWRGRLRVRFSPSAHAWLGAALLVDALVAYPVTGWLAGRPFPTGPMFGMTPWSVVVFTLGMLLLTEPPAPKQLLVLPLLLALLSLPAAARLGPAEDLGMATAALVGLFAASTRGLRHKRRVPAMAGTAAPREP